MSDADRPDDTPQHVQLNIELREEQAEGIYSNLVMIAQSPEEFILDFIRVMPGLPKARVKSRVVITPQHARRLLAALETNIKRYEARFGPIRDNGAANPIQFFGGPSGKA